MYRKRMYWYRLNWSRMDGSRITTYVFTDLETSAPFTAALATTFALSFAA